MINLTEKNISFNNKIITETVTHWKLSSSKSWSIWGLISSPLVTKILSFSSSSSSSSMSSSSSNLNETLAAADLRATCRTGTTGDDSIISESSSSISSSSEDPSHDLFFFFFGLSFFGLLGCFFLISIISSPKVN